MRPGAEVVTLLRQGVHSAVIAVGGWPDKQVDRVLAMAVDEGGDRAPIDIVQPTPDQGKPLRRQVLHRRGEIQFAIKPRFDRVLIRR